MSSLMSLAWRNLWRHKRRTWLTVGAMIFSNVLLVFMISLQFGSYDMMIENSLKAFSGHVQVSAKGYSDEPKMRLVIEDIESRAEQIRGAFPELVVAVRGETFVMASSDERSFGIQIAGVDVAHESNVSSIPGLITQGYYLRPTEQQEVVVGKVLARNLKVGVGDEITLLGSGFDGSFAAAVVIVRGIFESNITELDRSLAQISLASFQELFNMGRKGHVIIANAPNINDSGDYQHEIQKLMLVGNKVDHGLEVQNWKELNPGLMQAIKSDMASAWFMYIVLIVLVSFSVLNTQLMSVLERTREFGIMTAIGLRPSSLGKLVLLETAAMASIGLVIGTGLGFMLSLYLNEVGLSIPGMADMAAQYNLLDKMYPAVDFISISIGPLTVFFACLIAAIYPIIKLQGLEPVPAMRAA